MSPATARKAYGLPRMKCQSPGLTAAARTLTSTSPSPGTGAGTSCSSTTSGGP
ncbi:hypothetical protein [Nonomuraea salmonea]|uniref:hypothetical protein n=1 Tax=Nonomuraea salmonea TaxID=46181 RepID=UPI0031EAB93A